VNLMGRSPVNLIGILHKRNAVVSSRDLSRVVSRIISPSVSSQTPVPKFAPTTSNRVQTVSTKHRKQFTNKNKVNDMTLKIISQNSRGLTPDEHDEAIISSIESKKAFAGCLQDMDSREHQQPGATIFAALTLSHS